MRGVAVSAGAVAERRAFDPVRYRTSEKGPQEIKLKREDKKRTGRRETDRKRTKKGEQERDREREREQTRYTPLPVGCL